MNNIKDENLDNENIQDENFHIRDFYNEYNCKDKRRERRESIGAIWERIQWIR